ncbi:hypothetical protein AB0M36_04610 [Actinoplanes sp. NPDC051346]|uniref:hypothetical protein n=1 Tax=Actinoplanes sp. NPDC051346 TaxID=3155048 RepID=UPI0034151089
MRRSVAVVLVLVCAALMLRAGGWFATAEAMEPAGVVTDDAGDELATTSYDGPMVRKRAAIAIHPAKGADRARIARELRASAKTAGVGPLEDATFAVFSAQLLEYLVPELTFVLPEGTLAADAEAFMRDHQPRTVAFYLVEPVVVHDLTFGVVPAAGVSPADVLARVDREGILADSLNHYEPTVQRSGLTVRYFGAILSDGRILAVREALGRAAGVPAERVAVSANLPGPGVDLSQGLPNLAEGPRPHHG